MENIYQNWLSNLPAATGEFKKIQENGRKAIGTIGFPKKDQEEWRLTDLKRMERILKLPIISKVEGEEKCYVEKLPEINKKTTRIIINNIGDRNNLRLPSNIKKLSKAEVNEYFSSQTTNIHRKDEWEINFNQSIAEEILGLRIIGKEFQSLEIIINATSNHLIGTKILIILDKEAKLNLLEVLIGSKNSAISHATEIYLEENSNLNHGFIASSNKDESSLLSCLKVYQEIDSNYNLTSIQNGWSISRFKPEIVQLEGQAHTQIKGLQVAINDYQISTQSIIKFNGPNGTLEQVQKTIAANKSHSIFNGAIIVPKVAQKTNASQLSRNLIISDKAKIDTKPELKIIADDVRCAHGATVSQLQDDELFYLQSRGLDVEDAINLLLRGYCQEILNNLPVEFNKWEILNHIIKNIRK